MLLALIALAAAWSAGWLSGRRPPPAAGGGTAWRRPALAGAGAVAVAVSAAVPGHVGVAVMAAGYGGLIGFAVLNRARTGSTLLALGLLANAAVVLVDAGMPVTGLAPGASAAGHHHGLSTGDHLTGLADTIRVGPLGETVSPGDLLAIGGGATALFSWLEPPGAGRRPQRRSPRRDRTRPRRA